MNVVGTLCEMIDQRYPAYHDLLEIGDGHVAITDFSSIPTGPGRFPGMEGATQP